MNPLCLDGGQPVLASFQSLSAAQLSGPECVTQHESRVALGSPWVSGQPLPEGGEERIPAGVLWLALSPASCPEGDVLTASGFSPRLRAGSRGPRGRF